MAYTCPQCGAAFPPGETCETRFHLLLAREFEDPAYGIVHQFTVPCYMLQHNLYSRAGWLESRALLARFVQGLPPDIARQQLHRQVDSGQRAWNFTRGEKLAAGDQLAWTRTITDVRLDTAEHYCADVRAWAARVVADTETLVGTLAGEHV
ncbi:MAG: DUF5946 family protein [Thermomicrobiales bacterium]